MIAVKKLLKEPLTRIFITLGFCFLTYAVLPIPFIQGALTISIFLKNLLLFFLPLLILSGTALAFASFKGNGIGFVLTLMAIVILSNFCNLMMSGVVGCYVIPYFAPNAAQPILATAPSIEPYYLPALPPLLPNAWALIIGVASGLIHNLIHLSPWMKCLQLIHRITLTFILKVFIPALPLFLMGFILKLLVEGQMSQLIRNNGRSCTLMVGFLFLYLCLWWLTASRCGGIPAITLLKNILPAIITGATTMSSAAALPFSIEAATRNTKNPVLANAVMPMTVNFHMLGDTICIPILSLIILHSFGMPMPSMSTYFIFGLCFVMNKFAGAGIPGGSIMVSLPILQHYFGFSEEMLALITAFYMLIDPMSTLCNVTANNFLIIFIQRIWEKITHKA